MSSKPPFPFWTSVFHIVFQLFFISVCGYWYFYPPSPGKAVAAIGLAAVLMTLCEMKWHHKAVWLALVFFLAFIENKSIDNDRRIAKQDQDAAFGIARSTSTTATQTQISVVLLGTRLDDLGTQIRQAQSKNDIKLVAQLEKDKEKATKQLLLALAPQIAGQLHEASRAYQNKKVTALYAGEGMARTLEEQKQLKDNQARATAAVEASQQQELKLLLPIADSLRQQMLQWLPQTDNDKAEAELFAKALKGDLNSFNESQAADYLDQLTKRLSADTSNN